jgi:CBS domain-containing protein
VHDYVDGKADWMAYGLPVEGRDGPFLGAIVTDVPTCDVHGTVGDARALLERAGPDATVIVLAAGGLAVGEVGRETLEGHDDGHPLLDVMDPVPTTVRPSVTVASLAESGGGRQLVSTSDGRLLGQAEVEHGDHEGHDHEGHDHGDHEGHDHEGHDHEHDDDQEAEFDRELALVMDAIEERFGDREPSEAELRSFLHDRLVAEGRTPEDADRFLDHLESGEDD